MKIALTGASGLVGSALGLALRDAGHTVSRLVRSTPVGPEEISWDPARGIIDHDRLRGHEAVIHLAGESIAEGRWDDEKKSRIMKSRSDGTRLIAEAVAKMPVPPRVLIAASAVGYYGDRGDEVLSEDSSPGDDFLAEVCQAWEAATQPAAAAGVRVVNLRMGVVLSHLGGALSKMLLPFKMGAGGPLGSGRQYMSWIALEDLIGVILFALTHESVAGPVNAVSPQPVTNKVFTKALGRALSRPTFLPAPAFAMRIALGEMADALLLSSARVMPMKLEEFGYSFREDKIDALLHRLVRET